MKFASLIFLPILLAILLGAPIPGQATPIRPGSLIVSEIQANGGSIYAYDPLSNELSPVASGAPVDNPEGMAITRDGRIIVTDWYAWDTPAHAMSGDRGIYVIDPRTGSLEVILANGPLVTPIGVVIADNGEDLIVIDHGTNNAQGRVLKIDSLTGQVLATATHSSMFSPQGIVKDEGTGTIYVADHNGSIFEVDQDSLAITGLGKIPHPTGAWSFPQDLIVTENGKLLVVTLRGRIYQMDPATGATKLLLDDETPGDDIAGSSAFDGLAWVDDDTFAVVNHFSRGDILAFDYDPLAEAITSTSVLFDDGQIFGGPLYLPLGIERYDGDTTPVPEPATVLLLGSGIAVLSFLGRGHARGASHIISVRRSRS